MSQEPRVSGGEIQDEIDSLKAELAVAREQLGLAQEAMQVRAEERDAWREAAGKLEKALEFYARRSVWGNGCAAIDPCDTYTCEFGVLRGGKSAREALTAHAEFKKKMER